jgi:hypothetical protein
MKEKNKKSKRLLCITLAALVLLSVFAAGIMPVSANQASVTRVLPGAVKTNQEFTVMLNQSGFPFGVGVVNETLPAGFGYITGSYTGNGTVTYNPSTRKLTLGFEDDTNVTYRVKASSSNLIPATFSGTYITFVWDEVNGTLSPETGTVGGNQAVAVDGTPPYTDGHNPAKSATGVPITTNITVHIRDNYIIDPSSIVMTVKGAVVTPEKVPLDLNHWVLTYDPSVDFGYNEVVTVKVDAADTAGNPMTDTYSFTTTTGAGAGSISGKITYSSNTTGIGSATVNLTQGGGVIASTVTNGNGEYSFTNLPSGNYEVNASKPRFWYNSTAVTVAGATTANMMLWLKGDLYNDGVLDIYDVIMLRQAVVGNIPSDYRFDLYTDGTIDIYDVILLRQAIVGNVIL